LVPALVAKIPFYIVDVFAIGKYTGNQLAVFRNARSISESDMQSIAKEMNYSETTFILSDAKRDGGYDARIFTPEEELPFAGHPTLGTAYVVMREIIRKPAKNVALNLKVGAIPVSAEYHNKEHSMLWMKQKQPVFGKTVDARQVSSVLGISARDVDSRFPTQEVSTGLPFLIVPLKSGSAVARCKVSLEKYDRTMGTLSAKAILVFCAEPRDANNDLKVRVLFGPRSSIPEDPATGSANGCLAAYLVEYRYFGKPNISVKVEQGLEVGRPSLLHLKAKKEGGTIAVSVGGRCYMVAKGEPM
jgi:trans-2,3-dihydro-3-hydroxyanthranilate isomerase